MSLEKDFARAIARERRRANAGVVGGVVGFICAIFGMFTLGVIFLPLALLFSAAGVASGIARMNPTGIAISLIGLMFTAIGVAMSPSVWALVALSAK